MTPASWRPLPEAALPDLAALAARALAADGGLPLAAERPFLERRYAGAGVRAVGAWDGRGTLIAAGAVRPGGSGHVATGMVDPAARGRGLGGSLLDWALAVAAPSAQQGAAAPVTVEAESLTPQAAALFASRGLRQVFAEDVMRFDLAHPLPDVALPSGIRLEGWSATTAHRFFEVYVAAFAERPNFPGWPESRWLAWLADDDEFRPGCSLLAVDAERGDVGFVACSAGWITQVGVRPGQRGRRIGAGLVVEALRRMHGAGEPEALLDVNVDNPAGALYRRLGFEVVGRRARFTASPCTQG